MASQIPQEEVDSLLANVRREMSIKTLPSDIISGTVIKVIHPKYWEISLFVPIKSKEISVKASTLRKCINDILPMCGVDMETCDYFGREHDRSYYEWYFRHPNIPDEINDIIEAEIEAELGEEKSSYVPIPSMTSVSHTDTVFLTLKDKFFKEIESGSKTVEYRNINQYYCDKFFSSGVKKKFVKLNRGYQSGKENQMVYEIENISAVGSNGSQYQVVSKEGDYVLDQNRLPKNFFPACYAIKLGKRIS